MIKKYPSFRIPSSDQHQKEEGKGSEDDLKQQQQQQPASANPKQNHDEQMKRIHELEGIIQKKEQELVHLKKELVENYHQMGQHHNHIHGDPWKRNPEQSHGKEMTCIQELSTDQIVRYSRQLLLSDGFGVKGQIKLLSSSVLVIGAGGIGSTVLLYLAACGVGRVTIVDYDVVEVSNLHRQIIHTQDHVGMNKARSACIAIYRLNPTITCSVVEKPFSTMNALELVQGHDIVVDASDNPQTRYIVNDACVLAGNIPLVSGSAMGTEGQLSIHGGSSLRYLPCPSEEVCTNASLIPCYRCLYPTVNTSEACKSCNDNGVLGMVPGLIGILQAIEVVKVLTGIGKPMHDRLLMLDALSSSFLQVKKPPRRKENCRVCTATASSMVSIQSMEDSWLATQNIRGPQFHSNASTSQSFPSSLSITATTTTGSNACPNDFCGTLPQVTCEEYQDVRKSGMAHILLDVRVSRQYDLCSLPNSINIPLQELKNEIRRVEHLSHGTFPIYCICRRGIASVEATNILLHAKEEMEKNGSPSPIHSVYNIRGGYSYWSSHVDTFFPKY